MPALIGKKVRFFFLLHFSISANGKAFACSANDPAQVLEKAVHRDKMMRQNRATFVGYLELTVRHTLGVQR